ncbi:MAG: hypothetical protein B6I32_08715 [Desulfobacterium sp. 4572_20]|nr:MAG: hypothetical protein B6I32_08715 [Desulfobacterium sp. 4572_20]
MKKMLFFLMFFLFLGSLGLAMTCRPPDLPPHPTAEQIMQHWFDKKTGIAIFDEYYDKAGRKFKVIFRYYLTPEKNCWVSKERAFSPRILERMEW